MQTLHEKAQHVLESLCGSSFDGVAQGARVAYKDWRIDRRASKWLQRLDVTNNLIKAITDQGTA